MGSLIFRLEQNDTMWNLKTVKLFVESLEKPLKGNGHSTNVRHNIYSGSDTGISPNKQTNRLGRITILTQAMLWA